MFHFFPIAAAARCEADEQAFIFASEFRVQVRRLARRGSTTAQSAACLREGGLRCRSPTLRALRVNKKFPSHFKLICPVQSRANKEIPSRETQISPRTAPSRPARGAYRDRHERWVGLRWTRKRRARDAVRRAGFPVSDRQLVNERRICGRQNRVVLAPVAGVKPARFAKLNRAMRAVNSPAMEARGIRLQGERAISRQTIAQGRPDAPADTCMLVCVFPCAYCTRDRGCQPAPGLPCAL